MSLVDIESHACSELGRFKRRSRATLINSRKIKLAIRQRRKVMDSNEKREKDGRRERRGEINRERQRARNRKHNGKAGREKTRRRREMYSSSRLAAINDTIRFFFKLPLFFRLFTILCPFRLTFPILHRTPTHAHAHTHARNLTHTFESRVTLKGATLAPSNCVLFP